MANGVLRSAVARAVLIGLLGGLTLPSRARAADPILLREKLPPGTQYHVSSRVELSGSLTLPADKAKPGSAAKPLSFAGTGAVEYDERVLGVAPAGEVQKTARVYRRLDVRRTIGDQPQASSLRRDVARLVLLRHGTKEVPFSPDGPLLWAEIDLVRTDVFTPALTGFFPDRPVKPGDHWQADRLAVAELTDLDRIEQGGLECRFEEITLLDGRRYARVGFAGFVRGVNEDGPSRQRLDGYFFFDLGTNHLSYLSMHGTHFLLDQDGKDGGRIDGQFVLTRQVNQTSPELSDERMAGVNVEPDGENTRLLYDNPGLGVRFLYPRRWRVIGTRGPQVTVDDAEGSGVMITVETPDRVPTGAQFLDESRTWLHQQKAVILRVEPPHPAPGGDRLEEFAVEVELNRQRMTMYYLVTRWNGGGATLAARLVGADTPARREEVLALARSLRPSK